MHMKPGSSQETKAPDRDCPAFLTAVSYMYTLVKGDPVYLPELMIDMRTERADAVRTESYAIRPS